MLLQAAIRPSADLAHGARAGHPRRTNTHGETMHPSRRALGLLASWLLLACATTGGSRADQTTSGTADRASDAATLAQIYFWRAKPGKLEEYTRYIRERAEPIDEEARRGGAFLSVATYLAADTTVPWTHMRVFALRDSAQLRALGNALTAAGARLEPDSVKRRQQSEYSATLRDRVGAVVVELVR
jgi:hypothetical protein